MINTPRSIEDEQAPGDAPAKVVKRSPSSVVCRQTSLPLRWVLPNTYWRTTSALAHVFPHEPINNTPFSRVGRLKRSAGW